MLVVDDAVFMRRMVADALAGGGHEVAGEASNGGEALERSRELQPEVTTLDITMPEMDGISALKAILDLDPTARVFMCSALGQEGKVLEAVARARETSRSRRSRPIACWRPWARRWRRDGPR